MLKNLRKWFKDFEANLLAEMKGKNVNKRGAKSRKILGTNWLSLPDVSFFKVSITGDHPIFLHAGLNLRLKPNIEWRHYGNKRMNRYLAFQIKRLINMRSNPRRFWKVVLFLMRRSNCFRVSAINSVFPNWHRKMKLGLVLSINRKVSKIFNEWSYDLKYKRVYIEKSNGKWRPLGVPSLEWRLALHILNNFLFIFMKPDLLNSQHGFVPHKGTLTAWKEIINGGLLNKAFIYECDLKNFFNEVNITRVTEYLQKKGMPNSFVYWIENMNRCTPELTEEDKVDESYFRASDKDTKDFKEGVEDLSSDFYKPLMEFMNDPEHGEFNTKIVHDQMAADDISSYFEFVQMQWAIQDSFKPTAVPNQFKGFAQGVPTSPLLSISILKSFLTQVKSVSYADDPVFFDDKDFKIKDDPESGIILAKEKSSWVKRDGKWLKPLKFLGLVYDGNKNTLSSSTRKGVKLDMPVELAEFVDLVKFIEDKVDNPHISYYPGKGTWERLFANRYIGLIQSRLYCGDFNLEGLEQDFKLTFSEGSWIWKRFKRIGYIDKAYTVFNSSSFAAASLLHILNWQKYKAHKVPSKFAPPLIKDNVKIYKTLMRKREELARPGIIHMGPISASERNDQ